MNYRHIYHAGNVCDVVKHAAYALLIERMKTKDAAFGVLDTHAGCGLYDLTDPRALQTGEAGPGIHKLWSSKALEEPLLHPYLSILRDLNPDGVMRFYPGSPLLARRSMRAQDRLIACELHPEDAQELRRHMRREEGIQLHQRDGYEGIKAFLPLAEKRGLVLIDPPFETPDEIDNLIKAAQLAHARMTGAVIAIWYPIKERPAIWRFHEALTGVGLPKMLKAEFLYRPEVRADRLNGSGLVIVNTPWTFEEELKALFATLHAALETETRESVVDWLKA